MGIDETHLVNDSVINVDNYEWFGNNRKHILDFIPFSIDSRCLLQIGDESPDIYVYVLSHTPLIYM